MISRYRAGSEVTLLALMLFVLGLLTMLGPKTERNGWLSRGPPIGQTTNKYDATEMYVGGMRDAMKPLRSNVLE